MKKIVLRNFLRLISHRGLAERAEKTLVEESNFAGPDEVARKVPTLWMEAFMNRRKTLATVAAAGLAVAIGFTAWSTRSDAADHLDPPTRTDPMANGMDRNADIADSLGISVNTVKTRLRRLYAKLRVANRDEAIARARERGLLEP